MKYLFFTFSFITILAHAEYRSDVCFEKSDTIWKVKKPSNLSSILKSKKLTPLWCDNCSVNTTATINNLINKNALRENSLITLPQKCIPLTDANAAAQTSAPTPEESTPELNNPVELQLVAFNKFIITPILAYKNLKSVNSPQMSASLSSQLGYGLGLGYQHSFDDHHAFVGDIALIQFAFTNQSGAIRVIDNSFLFYDVSAGYKWTANSNWALRLNSHITRNEFLTLTNTNSEVKIALQNNLSFSIEPEWIFFRTDYITSSAKVGYTSILESHENSLKTTNGQQYTGILGGTYKLNWGRIAADFETNMREQTAESIKNREMTYKISASTIYLY